MYTKLYYLSSKLLYDYFFLIIFNETIFKNLSNLNNLKDQHNYLLISTGCPTSY